MKFGSVPIAEAEGATVAHAVHVAGVVLKKGDIVGADHILTLSRAGVRDIIVARLSTTDVGENEAARRIAESIGGAHLSIDRAFTGRANLFAERAGVLRIDTRVINQINDVDEAITIATLPDFRAVELGEMVATVKIIPFAVSGSVVDHVLASAAEPVLSIAPFRPMRVGVVSTVLPGLKPSVVTKTLSHLADRLAPAGATITADERVAHDAAGVEGQLRALAPRCDILVVFGASAITDRRDVIPSALEQAGGRIESFGMPVDPGNLLLLGDLDGKPVIGAPGCARSPKENGFDWVLQRLLAGLTVTRADIRGLGVGGLLMEIVSRPQPRIGAAAPTTRTLTLRRDASDSADRSALPL